MDLRNRNFDYGLSFPSYVEQFAVIISTRVKDCRLLLPLDLRQPLDLAQLLCVSARGGGSGRGGGGDGAPGAAARRGLEGGHMFNVGTA